MTTMYQHYAWHYTVSPDCFRFRYLPGTTPLPSPFTTSNIIMGGGVLMTQIFRDLEREREREREGAETSVGQKETSLPR